jgi:hypothetical protein
LSFIGVALAFLIFLEQEVHISGAFRKLLPFGLQILLKQVSASGLAVEHAQMSLQSRRDRFSPGLGFFPNFFEFLDTFLRTLVAFEVGVLLILKAAPVIERVAGDWRSRSARRPAGPPAEAGDASNVHGS